MTTNRKVYSLQLFVDWPGTLKAGEIAFMDVEADSPKEARELAKKLYEEKNPGANVHLFHPLIAPDDSGSPQIYRVKGVDYGKTRE